MKILTIDGNNLVHRVYWVAENMKHKAENMHVYMFLNSVRSYVDQFKPDKVFCAWDEKPDGLTNKRKELLEEYKGNRDHERNQNVHTKNDIIKKLLTNMGIPSIFPQRYEADDAIKIINDYMDKESRPPRPSKFYKTKQPFQHVIVTVDKDLCQLISNKVSVYDPIRKVLIKDDNFKDVLKYHHDDFITVKALTGDKSDNIPGIKGMGKVKVGKYLAGEYTLTDEEQELYEKNLQLVTLTSDKDEVVYVKSQLMRVTHDANWETFLAACKELKFEQIVKHESKWYSTFFQKNRLEEILS
jgi:DNA polymerase-1